MAQEAEECWRHGCRDLVADCLFATFGVTAALTLAFLSSEEAWLEALAIDLHAHFCKFTADREVPHIYFGPARVNNARSQATETEHMKRKTDHDQRRRCTRYPQDQSRG